MPLLSFFYLSFSDELKKIYLLNLARKYLRCAWDAQMIVVIFLESFLDLMWALCSQIRLRSGLAPAYTCFQSPQWPTKSTISG